MVGRPVAGRLYCELGPGSKQTDLDLGAGCMTLDNLHHLHEQRF